MKNRPFYFLFVFLLLISGAFVVKKIKRNHVPQLELSSLVLKNIEGRNIDLASFAGNPIVINFWGTWCGPCRQEFPDFESVKQDYGARVIFIMVSDESLDKIAKFKSENRYTFLYAQSQKKIHDMGISAVPATYFYDTKGRLLAKKMDAITKDKLTKIVASLMNE